MSAGRISRIPLRATYRLQFNADFPFEAAIELADYLSALGISHLYASPIFEARRGSSHGYDITDPTRISAALGGEEGFRRLAAVLAERRIGIVLDIVPNHMAADEANPFWMAALEFGREGPAGHIFDIDWERPVPLPILDEGLETALANDDIALVLDAEGGRLAATWRGRALPLSVATTAAALRQAAERSGDEGLSGTAALWTGLSHAPADGKAIEAARAMMAGLSDEGRNAIAAVVAGLDLPGVLAEQHWALAHWQEASQRLTYRRFFNVSDLVGVRVEDGAVFDLVHRLPLALLKEGLVDGFRVDHVDGLADPAAYCRRLRKAAGRDALIVVEKILGRGERLRDWPVDGTTGYERLNDLNGLFVDPDGYRKLSAYFEIRFAPPGGVADHVAAAKRQVLEEIFVAETEQLVRLAAALAGERFDAQALRGAIRALVTWFPVYRSYVADPPARPDDLRLWRETLSAVEREAPAVAAAAAFLVMQVVEGREAAEFRRRIQQLTGPVMAKGYEDTELYRSVALASVCEVGSDLANPARTVEELHGHARERVKARRRDLVPLSTHDTKRGADTRARINTLAAMPRVWLDAVDRWNGLNRDWKGRAGLDQAPDDLDEWLIYETLVGAAPIASARLAAYVEKAVNEAKRHSRWEAPNTDYLAAATAFATALVDDDRAAGFRHELMTLVGSIAAGGRRFGIAQTILQLTLPGIPDIYQGGELWDHALVDPDNRRPVDWPLRRLLISGRPEGLRLAEDIHGALKLATIAGLLALRGDQPALFEKGDHAPLAVPDDPLRWFAFRRHAGETDLVVAVPTRFAEGDEHIVLQLAPDLAGTWTDPVFRTDFLIDDDGATICRPDWPFVVGFRKGG